MKNANWKNTLNRLAALLLTLVLLMPSIPVHAEEDPLSVVLNWLDAEGQTQTVQAQRLTYDGFRNYFWACLPAGTSLDGVTLHVADESGAFARFDPENGTALAGLVDAGTGIHDEPVFITCYDWSNNAVGTLYLYVSTVAEKPDMPAFSAPYISVRYVDAETGAEISGTSVQCALGATTAMNAPDFDGYTLVSDRTQYVTVDHMGNASANEVVFRYQADVVYSAPSIPVTCYDENGNVLHSWNQETVLEGTTTVTAPAFDGYNLAEGEAGEKYIYVNEKGEADVSEVAFYYTKIVYTAPVIPVKCYDENGEVIYSFDQTTELGISTAVTAPAFDGYNLAENEAGEKYIYVNEKGEADVSEVAFYYTKIVYTAPEIPVYCYDENGTVLNQWSHKTELAATTTVTAPEINGYKLTDAGEKYIVVDEKGMADVTEVTFTYEAIVYTAPAVSVVCADTDETVLQRWVEEMVLGGSKTIAAPQIPGYKLISENAEVTVNVTEMGEADVSEVIFRYEKINAPVVTVRCVDAADESVVLYTEEKQAELGMQNTLHAPHVDGYELSGDAEKYVQVDEWGIADVYEVTFKYTAIVYHAPAVNVVCLDRATNAVIHTETVQTAVDSTMRISAPAVADYQVSGSAEDYVTVDAKGNADKLEVVFYYDAIMYVAPVIDVVCVDETTRQEIQRSSFQTVINAANNVYAPAIEKYRVSGSAEAVVNVDYQGYTDIAEVTFYYRPISTPVVTVRFVDAETGKDIRPAEMKECPLGTSLQIEAPEVDKYTRPAEMVKTAQADLEGNVTPAEIVFEYQKVPVIALVNIIYRNQNNEVLYTASEPYGEGTHTITVDYSVVDMEQYELYDTDTKQVNVNAIGVTTPGEVVFFFREKAEVTGSVQILYCDESNYHVASPQYADCIVGNNEIVADPIDLKPDYELISERIQYVQMNEEGKLSPEKVVFYYRLKTTPAPEKTATPEPQLPYEVTAMDTYGYPLGDDINFRFWPTTKDNNVIRTVNRTDLAHIVGAFRADDNKDWYITELVATGEKGYLRADKVRLLSQDEINALMGYTPVPTPEATPVPTEVPDDVAIDRWAVTKDSVRFRKGPSTNDDVISNLKRNTQMWVYQADTVNGERWYRVNIGGTEGYVMAEFVDLLSQEDSDKLQQALSTPMPTRSPEPTRMPTTEVTVSPTPDAPVTPAPTETVAPTATPEPYRGYALTIDQTALRTGVSQTDESVLELVKGDSLVLITAQTYVNGVCWDNVEVISSGSVGFMQDAALIHINNEQAREYLDALAPVVTASPVPTETPPEVNGYAITLGDGVMLRAFADTNANILKVMPVDSVVIVYEQEYVNGEAWHIVNAGDFWGYIRYDQVRMMTEEEVIMYLESFKTATPIPESSPTPAPVTNESLSSYGYVNTDKVNMRDSASTNGGRIRLLDKYAFALVMGQEQDENGNAWYRISQAGKEGYVMSEFFTVLSIGELNDFLTSDEYINSGSNDSGSSGNQSADKLQSVEDYNTGIWQNPALSASYEPFNPFATATPNPEAVFTNSPAPVRNELVGKEVHPAGSNVKLYSSASFSKVVENLTVDQNTVMTVLKQERDALGNEWLQVEINHTNVYVLRNDVVIAEATATPAILDIGQVEVPEDNAKTSRNATGIILLCAAGVAAAGAGYAYYVYRKNERRRQAVREQQIRQQAQRSAQQPQTRAAQNNPHMQMNRPGYSAQQRPGGYMPPQGMQQRPVPPTDNQKDMNRPVQQVPQQTMAYKPQHSVQGTGEQRQATQQFRPVQNGQTPAQGMNAQPSAPANQEQTPVRVRRSDRYKNQGGNA